MTFFKFCARKFMFDVSSPEFIKGKGLNFLNFPKKQGSRIFPRKVRGITK